MQDVNKGMTDRRRNSVEDKGNTDCCFSLPKSNTVSSPFNHRLASETSRSSPTPRSNSMFVRLLP